MTATLHQTPAAPPCEHAEALSRLTAKIDTLARKLDELSAVSGVIYSAGRSDERAAILGGARPGRPAHSPRPARSGARPDYLRLAGDGLLKHQAAGMAAILRAPGR